MSKGEEYITTLTGLVNQSTKHIEESIEMLNDIFVNDLSLSEEQCAVLEDALDTKIEFTLKVNTYANEHLAHVSKDISDNYRISIGLHEQLIASFRDMIGIDTHVVNSLQKQFEPVKTRSIGVDTYFDDVNQGIQANVSSKSIGINTIAYNLKNQNIQVNPFNPFKENNPNVTKVTSKYTNTPPYVEHDKSVGTDMDEANDLDLSSRDENILEEYTNIASDNFAEHNDAINKNDINIDRTEEYIGGRGPWRGNITFRGIKNNRSESLGGDSGLEISYAEQENEALNEVVKNINDIAKTTENTHNDEVNECNSVYEDISQLITQDNAQTLSIGQQEERLKRIDGYIKYLQNNRDTIYNYITEFNKIATDIQKNAYKSFFNETIYNLIAKIKQVTGIKKKITTALDEINLQTLDIVAEQPVLPETQTIDQEPQASENTAQEVAYISNQERAVLDNVMKEINDIHQSSRLYYDNIDLYVEKQNKIKKLCDEYNALVQTIYANKDGNDHEALNKNLQILDAKYMEIKNIEGQYAVITSSYESYFEEKLEEIYHYQNAFANIDDTYGKFIDNVYNDLMQWKQDGTDVIHGTEILVSAISYPSAVKKQLNLAQSQMELEAGIDAILNEDSQNKLNAFTVDSESLKRQETVQKNRGWMEIRKDINAINAYDDDNLPKNIKFHEKGYKELEKNIREDVDRNILSTMYNQSIQKMDNDIVYLEGRIEEIRALRGECFNALLTAQGSDDVGFDQTYKQIDVSLDSCHARRNRVIDIKDKYIVLGDKAKLVIEYASDNVSQAQDDSMELTMEDIPNNELQKEIQANSIVAEAHKILLDLITASDNIINEIGHNNLETEGIRYDDTVYDLLKDVANEQIYHDKYKELKQDIQLYREAITNGVSNDIDTQRNGILAKYEEYKEQMIGDMRKLEHHLEFINDGLNAVDEIIASNVDLNLRNILSNNFTDINLNKMYFETEIRQIDAQVNTLHALMNTIDTNEPEVGQENVLQTEVNDKANDIIAQVAAINQQIITHVNERDAIYGEMRAKLVEFYNNIDSVANIDPSVDVSTRMKQMEDQYVRIIQNDILNLQDNMKIVNSYAQDLQDMQYDDKNQHKAFIGKVVEFIDRKIENTIDVKRQIEKFGRVINTTNNKRPVVNQENVSLDTIIQRTDDIRAQIERDVNANIPVYENYSKQFSRLKKYYDHSVDLEKNIENITGATFELHDRFQEAIKSDVTNMQKQMEAIQNNIRALEGLPNNIETGADDIHTGRRIFMDELMDYLNQEIVMRTQEMEAFSQMVNNFIPNIENICAANAARPQANRTEQPNLTQTQNNEADVLLNNIIQEANQVNDAMRNIGDIELYDEKDSVLRERIQVYTQLLANGSTENNINLIYNEISALHNEYSFKMQDDKKQLEDAIKNIQEKISMLDNITTIDVNEQQVALNIIMNDLFSKTEAIDDQGAQLKELMQVIDALKERTAPDNTVQPEAPEAPQVPQADEGNVVRNEVEDIGEGNEVNDILRRVGNLHTFAVNNYNINNELYNNKYQELVKMIDSYNILREEINTMDNQALTNANQELKAKDEVIIAKGNEYLDQVNNCIAQLDTIIRTITNQERDFHNIAGVNHTTQNQQLINNALEEVQDLMALANRAKGVVNALVKIDVNEPEVDQGIALLDSIIKRTNAVNMQIQNNNYTFIYRNFNQELSDLKEHYNYSVDLEKNIENITRAALVLSNRFREAIQSYVGNMQNQMEGIQSDIRTFEELSNNIETTDDIYRTYPRFMTRIIDHLGGQIAEQMRNMNTFDVNVTNFINEIENICEAHAARPQEEAKLLMNGIMEEAIAQNSAMANIANVELYHQKYQVLRERIELYTQLLENRGTGNDINLIYNEISALHNEYLATIQDDKKQLEGAIAGIQEKMSILDNIEIIDVRREGAILNRMMQDLVAKIDSSNYKENQLQQLMQVIDALEERAAPDNTVQPQAPEAPEVPQADEENEVKDEVNNILRRLDEFSTFAVNNYNISNELYDKTYQELYKMIKSYKTLRANINTMDDEALVEAAQELHTKDEAIIAKKNEYLSEVNNSIGYLNTLIPRINATKEAFDNIVRENDRPENQQLIDHTSEQCQAVTKELQNIITILNNNKQSIEALAPMNVNEPEVDQGNVLRTEVNNDAYRIIKKIIKINKEISNYDDNEDVKYQDVLASLVGIRSNFVMPETSIGPNDNLYKEITLIQNEYIEKADNKAGTLEEYIDQIDDYMDILKNNLKITKALDEDLDKMAYDDKDRYQEFIDEVIELIENKIQKTIVIKQKIEQFSLSRNTLNANIPVMNQETLYTIVQRTNDIRDQMEEAAATKISLYQDYNNELSSITKRYNPSIDGQNIENIENQVLIVRERFQREIRHDIINMQNQIETVKNDIMTFEELYKDNNNLDDTISFYTDYHAFMTKVINYLVMAVDQRFKQQNDFNAKVDNFVSQLEKGRKINAELPQVNRAGQSNLTQTQNNEAGRLDTSLDDIIKQVDNICEQMTVDRTTYADIFKNNANKMSELKKYYDHSISLDKNIQTIRNEALRLRDHFIEEISSNVRNMQNQIEIIRNNKNILDQMAHNNAGASNGDIEKLTKLIEDMIIYLDDIILKRLQKQKDFTTMANNFIGSIATICEAHSRNPQVNRAGQSNLTQTQNNEAGRLDVSLDTTIHDQVQYDNNNHTGMHGQNADGASGVNDTEEDIVEKITDEYDRIKLRSDANDTLFKQTYRDLFKIIQSYNLLQGQAYQMHADSDELVGIWKEISLQQKEINKQYGECKEDIKEYIRALENSSAVISDCRKNLDAITQGESIALADNVLVQVEALMRKAKDIEKNGTTLMTLIDLGEAVNVKKNLVVPEEFGYNELKTLAEDILKRINDAHKFAVLTNSFNNQLYRNVPETLSKINESCKILQEEMKEMDGKALINATTELNNRNRLIIERKNEYLNQINNCIKAFERTIKAMDDDIENLNVIKRLNDDVHVDQVFLDYINIVYGLIAEAKKTKKVAEEIFKEIGTNGQDNPILPNASRTAPDNTVGGAQLSDNEVRLMMTDHENAIGKFRRDMVGNMVFYREKYESLKQNIKDERLKLDEILPAFGQVNRWIEGDIEFLEDYIAKMSVNVLKLENSGQNKGVSDQFKINIEFCKSKISEMKEMKSLLKNLIANVFILDEQVKARAAINLEGSGVQQGSTNRNETEPADWTNTFEDLEAHKKKKTGFQSLFSKLKVKSSHGNKKEESSHATKKSKSSYHGGHHGR